MSTPDIAAITTRYHQAVEDEVDLHPHLLNTGQAVSDIATLLVEVERLQSLTVALWETLADVQRDGLKKGRPLPTWRITVEQAAALDGAVERAG